MTEMLPGVPKASRCEIARYHRPAPLRFIWHHVLPQACGGKTEPSNLAQLCDNDHYAVHLLMWHLAHGGIPPAVKGTRAQRALAQRGYDAAVAAGTQDQIPKEAAG
jgi:HNH endonuclease